ncbi:3-methylitaconate isomerase-like protein [Hapsidospora chrysogenum ATCC 11550]|uniref:3-methylitaconate isomerase-like protein n=1 Tax=Hapsidospora chrysogenum (strain ATCC 11550 / CBS 779.69 / DSM 880 / IAM 14645 / JCM 23072 / IMI 49137) TaxID=857340 RepID=A0A086T1K4_HAPC1|nr:3-methylitaconate isomerase-like protein [Hapsidospora chrysogenum ATCC 11550]
MSPPHQHRRHANPPLQQPRRCYSTGPSSHGQRSFPAWFVRGGTSNGLVIHRDSLPPQDQWHTVLPQAMGSPDQYGRQLNGIGSGISSTSKIVVLGPPSRPDVDVDYTFVQVGIKDGKLDTAGNCGNMSSAVGPVAWDWGLIRERDVEQEGSGGDQWASVRLFNTNTSKVLVSRFRVAGSPPKYCPGGDYVLDGVPGTASQITMSFMDPAGAKTGKALPTGNAVDVLRLSDGSSVSASLVDVSNPGVFITARELGIDDTKGPLTPDAVEADTALKARLGEIRRVGASMMGLDPDVESIPKVVMLFHPGDSSDADLGCLALSMGQAHKAVPLTLALCLGAASQLPGTVAAELVGDKAGSASTVTIGHPSGKLDIGTTVRDGKLVSAELLRTARVLMKGDVCY